MQLSLLIIPDSCGIYFQDKFANSLNILILVKYPGNLRGNQLLSPAAHRSVFESFYQDKISPKELLRSAANILIKSIFCFLAKEDVLHKCSVCSFQGQGIGCPACEGQRQVGVSSRPDVPRQRKGLLRQALTGYFYLLGHDKECMLAIRRASAGLPGDSSQ